MDSRTGQKETILPRLSQLKPSLASVPEQTILAEVLALRMVTINLLRALGNGEALTPEKVQKVIQWADAEKLTTAVQRLQEASAREKS